MSAIVLLAAITVAGPDSSGVDFDNQIIPILTKAGCNTGACHGAAVGRGGFRLSLYGGDPEFDYRSIVHEINGRRVNIAAPDESLLVLKPTAMLDHGGGYRLDEEGDGANLLLNWIRHGAVRKRVRQLVDVRVSPASCELSTLGPGPTLQAVATFDDGSQRNVTRWTVFTAEDPASIEIDDDTAETRVLRRGRHIVVARYLNKVVPVELIVPLSDKAIDLSNVPRKNFIDDHVLELLSTLRLPVSGVANEAAYLRRITLDLTGRLPLLEDQQAYLASEQPNRREELVDRLLGSDEFTEYWTLQLAKLLRIRSQPQDAVGALAYHNWLKTQMAQGLPYDQLAREVLTASGDSHEVGPANFYRTVGGPREQAEFASELFMGNRLRCANCHNHPLDRWTQDDYHGLAAIFAKLKTGRVIEVARRGEVTHPRTGESAVPRIPGEQFLIGVEDGRASFATWLTSKDNPYFAKAMVNRLWKSMMGRGLIEPTDDLRATNPATHPALLEQLAQDFVENGYDMRQTLRRIALSDTYGRSARPTAENRADDRYYSHAFVRPLPPEVQADIISDVVGLGEKYGDEPPGTRAVSLFDTNIESKSLDILGRCSRTESCETADESEGGLTRKLHMLNGPLLNRRIVDPGSRLVQLLQAGTAAEEIVAEFYQRALGRVPTVAEREYWKDHLDDVPSAGARKDVLEDFVWSLLSCREFITNH